MDLNEIIDEIEMKSKDVCEFIRKCNAAINNDFKISSMESDHK